MESAKEEEQLAIEDYPGGELVLAESVPRGPPVVYGPTRRGDGREKEGKGKGLQGKVVTNPFWSERLQNEVMLRAMRPAALPTAESEAGFLEGPSTSGRVEPGEEGRGFSMDIQELLKAVMTQNAALKKELAELRKTVETKAAKAIEDQPRPPTTTPPPSPPKAPPPTTPDRGRKEARGQAWADVEIPEFPVGGIETKPMDPMRRDGLQRGSGVPGVPGSWGAQGWGLHPGRQPGEEPGHHGVKEGMQELMKGSPLEQAAQSVLRQLGTSSSDGNWGEVIRSVELPPLQDLREGDLGSLILGDWIQLITPTMKDLSATSWKWWEEVLNLAMVAYRDWLQAEPVQRLYIRPRTPPECSGVWSRLEQRGQLMLINAAPQNIKAEVLASRTTSSVEVLYALFRRYQPGGLAERSRLLRQLVEPKAPQSMNEVVEALRGWRRSLRRAQELDIATPDATLLLGALDKMTELVGKRSSQVAFRMSSTRATLGVDVTPNLETVLSFADMLTAEAESLAISELQPIQETKGSPPATKVKAMTATMEEKTEKGTEKAKVDIKPDEKTCRFWGSDDGCRKGQDCRFKHDWGGLEKKGRCFGCSSTKHTKRDCPSVKPKTEGDKQMKTFKKGTVKGTGIKKIEKNEGNQEDQQIPVEEVVDEKKVEKPAASSGEVQALLSEATTLLKSLRPVGDGRMAMKAIKLSSLEVRTNDRALLDGGATHCLRKAESEEEWQRAQEVRVELAEGSVLLRQIPWTKTLLTQNEVQTIVPLGVLISLGYEAYWERDRFTLTDPSGALLDVTVEGMCPTVTEGLGRELIAEIERSMVRERARLAVLNGEGSQSGLELGEVQHLQELRELFPEVPLRLLVRILPKVGWTGEALPWNRHERRRVRKAREVVIHLFSGDTKKYWQKELESEGRAVLCVDTVIDPGMNLLRDDVFAYLLEIADGGTLRALLGGPPCRTMSRLRYRQPGPPPLREREGPGRFGLPGLDPVLKQQVEDDTLLWLRQVYLHHRASKAASPGKVVTALEQPDDPEAYLGESKMEQEVERHPRYPTYWSWPEWRTIKEKWDLFEVRFDQGPMGHARRKPTRLGTNMPRLRELEGLRGPGHGGEEHRGDSIQERIARSKSWAAWAPGLKAALVVAVKETLERGDSHLKRMDLGAWQRHLLNGHLPYSRECRACVVAASRSKAHRRVPHPDAYTLSIDTAGPFEVAEDQLGKGRYLLVGVYLAPVTKEGQSLIPINEEDELPGALGDGPELTVVEMEEEGGVREKWPGLNDEKAWLEKVEAEKDFQVKQILIVEVLENRGGPAVVEGSPKGSNRGSLEELASSSQPPVCWEEWRQRR